MIRVLTVIVYLGTVCFIISASILISGWDFTTEAFCKAAIDLCLVFYLSHKTFMNLFLVERTYQIRAYKVTRHKDVPFYIGMAVRSGRVRDQLPPFSPSWTLLLQFRIPMANVA